MPEYGLYKNAEGYADPTAAEAIKGMAKPGEIWKYKDKEVLIVKNQGVYSNILTLSTAPGKDTTIIEVAGRYTTPGKLNYAFNSNLGAMVERIPGYSLQYVMNEISFALYGFTDISEHPSEAKTEATAETAVRPDYEAENKALKKKNSMLRSMYDDLLTKFLDRFGGCEEHG